MRTAVGSSTHVEGEQETDANRTARPDHLHRAGAGLISRTNSSSRSAKPRDQERLALARHLLCHTVADSAKAVRHDGGYQPAGGSPLFVSAWLNSNKCTVITTSVLTSESSCSRSSQGKTVEGNMDERTPPLSSIQGIDHHRDQRLSGFPQHPSLRERGWRACPSDP